MKKHFTLLNLALILSFCVLYLLIYDNYRLQKFVVRMEAINARIDYLRNEGYSILAAKHIADVEFKIIPADSEYKALIED